jgi:hypothetical protein
MRARSFSDDAEPAADDAKPKPEPDYVFEGYDIEFSTKVALTAPLSAKTAAPKRRAERS